MSTPTEARTRKELIDPALEQAGWDVNNPDQVGIEILDALKRFGNPQTLRQVILEDVGLVRA